MIYFAQAGPDGPIKVGYTASSVASRMAALQTGQPHRLTLLASVEGSPRDEAALHRLLAHERLTGEWFAGDETRRAACCDHCASMALCAARMLDRWRMEGRVAADGRTLTVEGALALAESDEPCSCAVCKPPKRAA